MNKDSILTVISHLEDEVACSEAMLSDVHCPPEVVLDEETQNNAFKEVVEILKGLL